MLSNLSIPLLGAVDTAVVGHLPDPVFIGGVAVGAIVFNFLYWGFSFLRMGTSGFSAQAHGAGNGDELRAVLARAMLLALVIGLLLIALQLPIAWLAFTLFDASAGVETQARLYFDIRIWSAPASLANYVMIGWLLGTGRARTMLLLQVTLNGLNIVLDLVFVLGLGWGVEGVALASLLAEVSAVSLGLFIIARALKVEGGAWQPKLIRDPERLVALFRVNRDILIRTLSLVAAFGYFTAQGAKMGDLVLAANAILLQFFAFMAYGIDGLSDAAEVLTGNAKGARNRSQFRAAIGAASLWAAGLAVLIALVFWLAGPLLIGLFTNLKEVRLKRRDLPLLDGARSAALGLVLPARRRIHRHDPDRRHAQCHGDLACGLPGGLLGADPVAWEPRLVAGADDLHGGTRADLAGLPPGARPLDRGAAPMTQPSISGFMVLRNGVKMGYPFVEAIVSSLPICDEFLISDGYSSDDTLHVLERLREIFPDKIKLSQDKWTTEPDDGAVIATVSNALLSRCRGNYCLYVQGNEILHETSRQEVQRLPTLYPEVELFKLPFFSCLGLEPFTHVEFRRRLFVNEPRIGLRGDAYDAGYDKLRLLKSPLRFKSYLLHRRGEMLCYLREPFYRYRGIFPESFLEKIAVRGSQYKDPRMIAGCREELRCAEQATEAARQSGQGTKAFWREMGRFHDQRRLDILRRAGLAPEDPDVTHGPADDRHPRVMRDLFNQWRYDPWASLERVDQARTVT